ncbi:unnamed protein product [Linum trigynum]|uniref:Uncharacterized protein n=1 Tax=Linum trigynum TaxID=586398 RepID=A0AAV2ESG5_9ROSI
MDFQSPYLISKVQLATGLARRRGEARSGGEGGLGALRGEEGGSARRQARPLPFSPVARGRGGRAQAAAAFS